MNPAPLSKETMDAAVGYLLDAQAAPEDTALRERIEAWLDETPEHRQAWTQARKAWAVLGDVERAQRAPSSTATVLPFTPRARSQPTYRRVMASLGALAASVALALAISPSLLLRLSADYATGTGQLRDVQLPDGTRVTLGARSAIDVDLTGNERRVRLVAGEAWFDVARDPAHPFVVASGRTETRVLGTAFEVRSSREQTQVGVARGHVRVSASGNSEDLLPGDRVLVDNASGAMREDKVPVASLAGWRDGYLFAENATVGEVVEEMRRYDKGWIVLADKALAARRITGLYDARRPAAALAAIVEPAGGSITRVTPYLTIIRAR
ncbi:FecR family protein [Novosphingobium resinovorum]|nr:FecR domain-containing protein [Novosphingobium resinovorum]